LQLEDEEKMKPKVLQKVEIEKKTRWKERKMTLGKRKLQNCKQGALRTRKM
jgi:hypothetical protein